MSGPAAAWYPDPHDPTRLRWWDGGAWTQHVETLPPPPTVAPRVETIPAVAAVPRDQSPPPTYNGAPSMAVKPAARSGELATVTAPWVTDRPASNPAPLPAKGVAPPPAFDLVRDESVPALGPPPRHDIVIRPNSALSTAKRTLLVGALVAAVGIGGFGVYSSGLVGSLTGARSSSREASSDKVQVHEGSGYSFEVPSSWAETEVKGGSYDFGFAVPNGSISVVTGTEIAASVNMADPAVREFIFDTAARGLQLDLKGLPVTTKVPFAMNGAQGQQIVLSSTGGDGQPTQVIQTVFVHGRKVFLVAMIGHGILADDPATHAEYDAVLSSFRFN